MNEYSLYIPDDVYLQILDNIPLKDLYKCMMVSKQFNILCRWLIQRRNITISIPAKIPWNQYNITTSHFNFNSQYYVRTLTIRKDANFLGAVWYQRLTNLILMDIDILDLKDLSYTNIRKLTVIKCNVNNLGDITTLDTLILHDVSVDTLEDVSVSTLELENCVTSPCVTSQIEAMKPDHLKIVLSGMPKCPKILTLKTLDYSITTTEYISEIHIFTKITTLRCCSVKLITLTGFENLICLRSINCSFNGITTLKCLGNLESLHTIISIGTNISRLCGKFPALQRLNLAGTLIKSLNSICTRNNTPIVTIVSLNVSQCDIIDLDISKFTRLFKFSCNSVKVDNSSFKCVPTTLRHLYARNTNCKQLELPGVNVNLFA